MKTNPILGLLIGVASFLPIFAGNPAHAEHASAETRREAKKPGAHRPVAPPAPFKADAKAPCLFPKPGAKGEVVACETKTKKECDALKGVRTKFTASCDAPHLKSYLPGGWRDGRGQGRWEPRAGACVLLGRGNDGAGKSRPIVLACADTIQVDEPDPTPGALMHVLGRIPVSSNACYRNGVRFSASNFEKTPLGFFIGAKCRDLYTVDAPTGRRLLKANPGLMPSTDTLPNDARVQQGNFSRVRDGSSTR